MNEERIKQAFRKVKEDIEGVKDELAFTLKRIAKIESNLTKESIKNLLNTKKTKKQ